LLEPLIVGQLPVEQLHFRQNRGYTLVSVFHNARYRPEFPARGFADPDQARTRAANFVHWYNHAHRHSGIRYVTAAQRHAALLSRGHAQGVA